MFEREIGLLNKAADELYDRIHYRYDRNKKVIKALRHTVRARNHLQDIVEKYDKSKS